MPIPKANRAAQLKAASELLNARLLFAQADYRCAVAIAYGDSDEVVNEMIEDRFQARARARAATEACTAMGADWRLGY